MKSRSVAIIALTALTASGCGVGVHFANYRHNITPADTHVDGPVSAVRLDSDHGRIVVRGGGASGVTVHRVVHYQNGTPHPSQRLTDGTLTFSSGCSRCSIDYELVVPATMSMRVRTDSSSIAISGVRTADASSDSGSVAVRHVTGSATTHSDSGSLTAQDISGTFQGATDSGSIHATELHAESVTASSDSGSINLVFASPPKNVKANDDSGSIHVTVPGGPYNVDAHTDSGGNHVRIPTNPAAPAKLSLHTDSGSVNVLPAT